MADQITHLIDALAGPSDERPRSRRFDPLPLVPFAIIAAGAIAGMLLIWENMGLSECGFDPDIEYVTNPCETGIISF
jgi:hypothetical protein